MNNPYSSLAELRKRGWRVAVHKDYVLSGENHTFWLFTASHGPFFVKGESTEDFYALNQCLSQADTIDGWSRGDNEIGPMEFYSEMIEAFLAIQTLSTLRIGGPDAAGALNRIGGICDKILSGTPKSAQ